MDEIKSNLSFLIIDDFSVVRKGIEILLKSSFANSTTASVSSYNDALTLLRSNRFDVIILDITMNGVEDTSIVNKIRDISSFVKILIFSSHDEKKYGVRFIKNGANGYVNKECSDDMFVTAIREIVTKGKFYSKDLQSALQTRKSDLEETLNQLSIRELEVYGLLVKGYGSLEISNKLDIHMSTVSTYKNRLFKKLGVSNIVELIDYSNLN